jgi:hypothetical protein
MEKLTSLTKEEMSQIDGGSLIGFAIGYVSYFLEQAAESIASHPVGGSRRYEI